MHRSLLRPIGCGAVAILFLAVTIYLTSYIARLPESNCSTAQLQDFWSADRRYRSVLMKKECNLGETIFYSVRLETSGKPRLEGWYVVLNIEGEGGIDEDEPSVEWISPNTLEIKSTTGTLKGTIERRIEEVTIIRSYRPRGSSP